MTAVTLIFPMLSTPPSVVHHATIYQDVRDERLDMQRQQQSRVRLNDFNEVVRNLSWEFESTRDPNVDNNERSVA
jgi:hypothetical protein